MIHVFATTCFSTGWGFCQTILAFFSFFWWCGFFASKHSFQYFRKGSLTITHAISSQYGGDFWQLSVIFVVSLKFSCCGGISFCWTLLAEVSKVQSRYRLHRRIIVRIALCTPHFKLLVLRPVKARDVLFDFMSRACPELSGPEASLCFSLLY